MHWEYKGLFNLLYLSAGLQEVFKNFPLWAPQDLIDVATWPEQVCQLSRSLSSLSMFHQTYVRYLIKIRLVRFIVSFSPPCYDLTILHAAAEFSSVLPLEGFVCNCPKSRPKMQDVRKACRLLLSTCRQGMGDQQPGRCTAEAAENLWPLGTKVEARKGPWHKSLTSVCERLRLAEASHYLPSLRCRSTSCAAGV